MRAAQERDDLVAVRARVAAEQVRERVAVRRHEVRPAGPAARAGAIAVPPALRRALVLAERAVEQAHEQVAVVRDHVAQDVVRARAERAAQPRDARGVRAERRGERVVVGDVGRSAPASRRSRSLFHSIWYAVRIGTRSSMSERRRDEHGERLAAVPAQRAAPAAGAHDAASARSR